VADRDSERIRRVQRDAVAVTREESQDHRADLRLLGLPVSDDRLLHQPRLVLEHRNLEVRGRGEQHSASVRQLDGGRDVLRGEDRLDGDGHGPELVQERDEFSGQEVELPRESQRVGRAPDSATIEVETPALEDDGSITGGRGAGIEAEDDAGGSAQPASSKSKFAQTF
jgi:hypothetical protein